MLAKTIQSDMTEDPGSARPRACQSSKELAVICITLPQERCRHDGSGNFSNFTFEHIVCRPFHKLPLPKLAAAHTGSRGWGITAEEFIPSGAFIVEYTGLLLYPCKIQ